MDVENKEVPILNSCYRNLCLPHTSLGWSVNGAEKHQFRYTITQSLDQRERSGGRYVKVRDRRRSLKVSENN